MTTPQQQAPSADDLMFGGNGPSRTGRTLSFRDIGASHTIVIKNKEAVQKRDDDGELEFWPDGNPKWQVVLTGQTDYRSPNIEDDDGIRYMYLDGSKLPGKKTKMSAAIEAVQAAGRENIEIGGRLTMTYIGDGQKAPNAGPLKNAPKQYDAVYVPAADVAMSPSSPASSASAPSTAPAAQQPTSTVPAASTQSASAQSGAGSNGGIDWSKLSHVPPEVKVQLISVPGLTTEAVLAMHPAPAPAASNGNGGGLSEFEQLRREDFPNITDLQWNGIKEAVEQKGVPVASMKAAFGVLG